MITEMPSSRSAPNKRCAVPGTPIIPVPSRFSSAIPSIVARPFTSNVDAAFASMRVPGCSGLNVLRMKIGSPRSTAGAIVLGWITFAPKYASSIASLYDSASSVTASGTRRGFALITPSTSVQIWISSASSSAAKIDALKSLPLRPSVVATPSDVDATKPVMTSVDHASALDAIPRVDARSRRSAQSIAGAATPRFDDQHVARVQPVARRASLGQMRRENLRRPDLAVAGDKLQRVARVSLQQRRGVEHVADVREVALEAVSQSRRDRRGHELVDRRA